MNINSLKRGYIREYRHPLTITELRGFIRQAGEQGFDRFSEMLITTGQKPCGMNYVTVTVQAPVI